MANHPTKITIFGGAGNLGSSIVNALLATGKHKIRAITRQESHAKFPKSVDVVRGDLASSDFLTAFLKGQDAVVIALGLTANPEIDSKIVTAAAEVDVEYIFPNEFVSQDSLRKHFPFGVHEKKNKIRNLIDHLGKSKWIAIVNGTWYDYSLAAGVYGIDILNRRAKIWTPGTVAANVTTVTKVGEAVAALLSLPADQLAQYTNRCVYFSSFRMSQLDILHSVQRVTNTQDSDWIISYEDVNAAVREGQESAGRGNIEGFMKVIYALQFVPNAGGDYETTEGTANKVLGLGEEEVDVVTRSVVEKVLNN